MVMARRMAAYNPSIAPYRTADGGVRLAGAMPSDPDAVESDCLIVRMVTRTGKDVHWANLFMLVDGRVVLGEPVVTYPLDQGTC